MARAILPFDAHEVTTRRGGRAEALDAYLDWQTSTLAALPTATGTRHSIEAIVWSARAGLGDSVFAFAAAISLAQQLGRLLFVDLDSGPDRSWSMGLAGPVVEWSWATHRVAIEKLGIVATPLHGHVTTSDPLVEEAATRPALPTPDIPHLLRTMIRPSPSVESIMVPHLRRFHETHVVGVQVRTGTALAPDPPFLQPGDEAKFVDHVLGMRPEAGDAPFVVYIVSDDEQIKPRLRGEFAAAGVDSLYLPASAIHTFRESRGADATTRGRILRTFAEFFLFSRVDRAVITARSLFGRAALEFGGVTDVHEIGS